MTEQLNGLTSILIKYAKYPHTKSEWLMLDQIVKTLVAGDKE